MMTTAHLVLLTVGLGLWLRAQEPIVGRPCEGCEAVFEGLPSSLTATARLSPAGEPGTPMTLSGRVLGADGRPRAGVIVYAYQTNTAGVYPPSSLRTGAAARHGALRGWALSGPDGRYTFETIRPGTYPTRDTPAHIHLHVIERGCATYYIDDVMFDDDPLLTPAVRKAQTMRGGPGIVTAMLANGRWTAARDIHLGRNIPGTAAAEPARDLARLRFARAPIGLSASELVTMLQNDVRIFLHLAGKVRGCTTDAPARTRGRLRPRA